MFSGDLILEKVQSGIPGSQAVVRDLTGTGDHFELKVVAAGFEGKNPVQRHKMVYQILGAWIGAEIHALSLKTLTPDEAKKETI